MANLKNKILILGEGITEFYFIQSLKDIYRGIDINPQIPKHTSMKELGKKIEQAIKTYTHIFCMIDMDTKANNPQENKLYRNLKQKYSKPIKVKEGEVRVEFFESHLCTELFFLYYFEYKTAEYLSQSKLIADLQKYCEYEKKDKFFRSCNKKGGLHNYFLKKGGNYEKAQNYSKKSMEAVANNNRDYTYTAIGKMLNEIDKNI